MMARLPRLLLVGVLAAVIAPLDGQSPPAGKPSIMNGEWPDYSGDLRGWRYSPLDQINASNFNQLQVAWRFKTDNLGPRPEYKLEGTPVMVKGMLYTTGGTRRSVVSLDGRTGELNWAHSLREGRRAAVSPRQLSGRGVSYWTDGKGDERVIYVTTGYQLVELDAKTGALIQSFANKGVLDLKVGVVKGVNQQIDLESGEIGIHSTPAVVGDIVIIGSSFREGATVSTHNNTKGLVRAFDVRTGKQLWRFNTIPNPGEYGHETWENDSWADQRQRRRVDADQRGRRARPRVFAGRDADVGSLRRPSARQQPVCRKPRVRRSEDRQAQVALPVRASSAVEPRHVLGAAAGRHQRERPRDQGRGRSQQAELSVCVRSRHRAARLADRGASRAARRRSRRDVLADAAVSDEAARPTRETSSTFRTTSSTSRPSCAHRRSSSSRDTSPVRCSIRRFSAANDGLLGSLSIGNLGGGTNWPGGGYDPETHIAYRACVELGHQFAFARHAAAGVLRHQIRARRQRPAVRRSVRARGLLRSGLASRDRTGGRGCGSSGTAFDCHGCRNGGGHVEAPAGGLTVQGLPIMKPPYGVLAAIQLDRGELLWQVPHGDTPDGVRNHPALKGLTIPKTGQNGAVGLARDQDAGDHGRSAGDDDAARARGDAARVRQGDGR